MAQPVIIDKDMIFIDLSLDGSDAVQALAILLPCNEFKSFKPVVYALAR